MPTFLDPTKHKTPFGTYPEISVDTGWPEQHHVARPRDAIGEAIISYRDRWQDHENFPASPWSPRHGEIHLPNLDAQQPETDPVPLYRLNEAAFVGPVLYEKNHLAPYAGWPAHPFTLEPVNYSAERVLRFMTRFGAGQKLPGMPHQSGRLNFPNPALRGSPISPTLRWAGAAA